MLWNTRFVAESPRNGSTGFDQRKGDGSLDNTARAIRDARIQAGLSLRELGSRAGVSASLLSQIETGRARPSVTTLYALVGSWDCRSMSWLPRTMAPVPRPGPPRRWIGNWRNWRPSRLWLGYRP